MYSLLPILYWLFPIGYWSTAHGQVPPQLHKKLASHSHHPGHVTLVPTPKKPTLPLNKIDIPLGNSM